MNRILGYLQLAKTVLCLLIGGSTLFGTILFSANINQQTLLLSAGVMILAMGGATINSLQERGIDAQMVRTRQRPLPQKMVPPHHAVVLAVLLIFVGILVVALAGRSILPVVLSTSALLLYNGVYTPLKKVTVLAIIPGAVCGALPPCIGWLGAGGGILSLIPVVLFALFVLWQVPHFWLVMLAYKQDYVGSEYPNMLNLLTEESIQRFFVTWIGGLAAIMIMFPILPLGLTTMFSVAVVSNSLGLLAVFYHGLSHTKEKNYRRLFIMLNISLFLHMVIVSVGILVGPKN